MYVYAILVIIFLFIFLFFNTQKSQILNVNSKYTLKTLDISIYLYGTL
jgi:hypothetical protein